MMLPPDSEILARREGPASLAHSPKGLCSQGAKAPGKAQKSPALRAFPRDAGHIIQPARYHSASRHRRALNGGCALPAAASSSPKGSGPPAQILANRLSCNGEKSVLAYLRIHRSHRPSAGCSGTSSAAIRLRLAPSGGSLTTSCSLLLPFLAFTLILNVP